MKLIRTHSRSDKKRTAGTTLPEFMVGIAVGSLVLGMAGSLWLFGSRSFAAMGNYTDLDNKSRSALDLMSRDIRQATGVISYNDNNSTKWLTVTNALDHTSVKYLWRASTQSLVCQKPGETDQVLLTGCDKWSFELFQRSPLKSGSYAFFPATNSAGACDLSTCKLVNMSWRCSRSIVGSRLNTESVQTAQVVLRNKQ